MNAHRLLCHGVACCLAALCASCSVQGPDDLQTWLQQQRNTAAPKLEPVPEPVRFVPQPYQGGVAPSPFSDEKLSAALRREADQRGDNTVLQAELNRPKEPLEAEPLDAIAMVGTLVKGQERAALVRVGALLYTVRVGNYLGPNYGRVVRISDSEITLREIVQSDTGEWTERMTPLPLQEATTTEGNKK
jgi:type IV pilus assembly protein PilP